MLGEMGQGESVSDKEMPKTLTEMYTQVSVFQITRMNEKNLKEKMIEKEQVKLLHQLGKLASGYLEKVTLIFCEKDLTECDTDVNTGALQVGL